MAATRLSDAQKQQIVARYQDGVSSADLAEAFGCSPNTVSRVVKAALSPEAYEALKQQRSRGMRPVAVDAAVATKPEPVEPAESESADRFEPTQSAQPTQSAPPTQLAPPTQPAEPTEPEVPAADADGDGPGVLPIDDADDFAADTADDDDDQDDDESGEEDDAPAVGAGHEPVQCRCISEAALPAIAYLLVDKTVELQPTPLSDCTELGLLPDGERDRQALLVYANQRQAKRHCGRSQRVIQLPDVTLLRRTAPYLLAKGISRVVIDGSLYSLPGS
jgi:transposase-like protein